MKTQRAFTLIELLVVIAIIGILSAVVLASLGLARERAREANVRATLKNMSAEIELLYADSGDYNFVNNCKLAGSPLKKFTDALTGQGALVACDALTITTSGVVDAYSRSGVAASLSPATPLVAFAASQNGVVKFDETNTGSAVNWSTAVSTCAGQGKRLPTVEEFRALYKAHGGTPPGFDTSTNYWSGSEAPGVSGRAYVVNMANNGTNGATVTTPGLVRCAG